MFNSRNPDDWKIWHDTYALTVKILKANPWKYFSDNNIFINYVSEYNTVCFCIFSKPTDKPLSLKIFEHEQMAYDYLNAKKIDNLSNNDFFDYYFEYCEILFDSPENIPEEQLKIYKDFNIFTNKEPLLPHYIESFSGFKPNLSSDDGLLLIIAVLENTLKFIDKIVNDELNITTNEDSFAYIVYTPFKNEWEYTKRSVDGYFETFNIPYLEDEELMMKIEDAPINSRTVELDLFFLNGEIQCMFDKKLQKVLILSFVDRETRNLLYFKAFENLEIVHYDIANYVVEEYIPKYGKMEKIVFRNSLVIPSLKKLFNEFGIEMEIDNLYATDESMIDLGFM